ncbi:MAG: hypothetical protein ACTSWL_06530 [Promethearchaeota archaeon]
MKNQYLFYFRSLSGFRKIGVVILIYQIFISGLFGIYVIQTNNHIQQNCSLSNYNFDDVIYFYSDELSLNEEISNKINHSISSIKCIGSNSFHYFDLNLNNNSDLETIRLISIPKSLSELQQEYPSIFDIDPNINSAEFENYKYFTFQEEGSGLNTVQNFNFSGQIASSVNISISGAMFRVLHPDQKQNITDIFKTINSPPFFHISDKMKYVFVNQEEFLKISSTTSLKVNGLSLLSLKTEEINIFSFKLIMKLLSLPSSVLYSPNREIGYYFLFENGIHSNFDKTFYTIRDQINITFRTLILSISVLFIFYFIKTMDGVFQKNMDFFKRIVIFGDGGIIKGKLIRDIHFKTLLSIFPFLLISDVSSMFYFSIPKFNMQASFIDLLKLVLLKDTILILVIFSLNLYLLFIFKLKSRLFFLKNENQQIYSLNVPKFKIKPYIILLLLLGISLFNFLIMDINHAYYIKNGVNSIILENFILSILPFLSCFLFSLLLSILFFRDFQKGINELTCNLTSKLKKYSDSEKLIIKYWLKRRKQTKFNLFQIILIILSFSFIGFINYQNAYFMTDIESLDLDFYPGKFYLAYSNLIQILGYMLFVLLMGEYITQEKVLFQKEILFKYSNYAADIKRLKGIKNQIEVSKLIITQIILIFSSFFIVFVQIYIISSKYFQPLGFFSIISSFNIFFIKTFIFFSIISSIIIFFRNL